MNKLRLTCLGLFAASLLAGCASTEKTDLAKKPVVDNTDYRRETPTGSWITKKVKKTETDESETAQAKDAMGELQRRGNQVPKDGG